MSLIERIQEIRNVGYSERQQQIFEEMYGLEKPRDFEKLQITDVEIQDIKDTVIHYMTTTTTNGPINRGLQRTLNTLPARRRTIARKKARTSFV